MIWSIHFSVVMGFFHKHNAEVSLDPREATKKTTEVEASARRRTDHFMGLEFFLAFASKENRDFTGGRATTYDKHREINKKKMGTWSMKDGNNYQWSSTLPLKLRRICSCQTQEEIPFFSPWIPWNSHMFDGGSLWWPKKTVRELENHHLSWLNQRTTWANFNRFLLNSSRVDHRIFPQQKHHPAIGYPHLWKPHLWVDTTESMDLIWIQTGD